MDTRKSAIFAIQSVKPILQTITHLAVVYVTTGNPLFCLFLYLTGVHFRCAWQHVGDVSEQKFKCWPIRTREAGGVRLHTIHSFGDSVMVCKMHDCYCTICKNFNTQIGENLWHHNAVMLTRITWNLYSRVKVNFTAVFIINIFHEKVYISQFDLFATWFIRVLYVTNFSNLSGDWTFIKLTANLNKL